MAWENCYISEKQGEYLKTASLPSAPWNKTLHDPSYFSTLNGALNDFHQWLTDGIMINANEVIYEDETWKLYTTSSDIYLSKNGANYAVLSNFFANSTYARRTFWACVDRENQKGVIGFGKVYYSQSNYNFVFIKSFVSVGSQPSDVYQQIYNFLTSAEIPTYTWQSVAGVSGKGQTYSLSQIASASINNGESVTGASASAFTSLSDSTKVSALVDVQELDDSKARVVYKIPSLASGSYSYAKLTYKQGHIPTNKDDGTSVDLDITSFDVNKTIDVSGIVTGSIYWFVIFTDKSESEPVKLGEGGSGTQFFSIDLSSDGRDTIRYNASKQIGHGNAKQGQLVGSNFNIDDDVLKTALDISWYYDGTENPKSIPEDCTLTFEYDVFFPNGEGYLDWYIIDSDNNQAIYWCFDTKHTFLSNKWYNCKTVCKVVDGKITRYKYVLDGTEVASSSGNIAMPCVNTETSKGISQIYFDITEVTHFKNMSIYYDFSEYHDGGGSGSGSSGST